MEKEQVYNLIILDESGSMESIKSSTMSGFNELVQTIRGIEKQYPEQQHFISLITFNGTGIKTKLDRKPAAELAPINENTYHPDASTPLYDAIGLGVLKLKMHVAAIENAHVLVTILTDGEENASKEFSHTDIKKIIDEQKSLGWTFTYIGSNHDVEKTAKDLSIINSIAFKSTDTDVKHMFKVEQSARMRYSKNIRNKADVSKDFYSEE